MVDSPALQARIQAVRDRVGIADVVGAAIKLGRGAKPRGKCPFHGSKSDSFAVDPATGRAVCWGCQWRGDAIAFVRDFYSLGFVDALQKLEGEHGLDGLAAAPVRRAKSPILRREVDAVGSADLGRWLWKHGRADHDAVRVYLRARGVPDAMLADERLTDVRFVAAGPIAAWRVDRGPGDVPQAPAMVALVRRGGDWTPIGVHATFLAPDLTSKMARQRRDGELYPARKMLGGARGGCVVLGRYDAAAPLFVGEGLETVLSGMAIAGAKQGSCGLAALSLDNLQGRPRLVRGALALHAPALDPADPPLAFAHGGPVTGLIDADMKPLLGPVDRRSGRKLGLPVIERAGGPVVRRAVSSAERSALCGTLFVQAWRALGCRATAIRPRMGQDFNDAVREAA